MEYEIRYPKLGDTLTRLEPDIIDIDEEQRNVLYADWMTGQWRWYANGYKEGADRLVEQVTGSPGDDTLVLPIIFMYRHFVELKLKDLIIHLERLSGTVMSDKQFTTHDILILWNNLKPHLSCIRNADWDNEIITSMDQLLKELSELDPDSYHFRYSHDTKFKEVPLPHSIHVRHFKTMMDILGNGLSYIEDGIYIEKDFRYEESFWE